METHNSVVPFLRTHQEHLPPSSPCRLRSNRQTLQSFLGLGCILSGVYWNAVGSGD